MDNDIKNRLLEAINLLQEVAEWEFEQLKLNPYYKAHKDHRPTEEETIQQ